MKILITLLVMLASVTFAQTNSYQAEIDAFFSLLEKGKPSEAIQRIYESNAWMNMKTEDIQRVDQQLRNTLEIVGEYCGKDHLAETKMKEKFIHIIYVAYYERQPLRFQFEFYKPKDQWMIYSFAFDGDIDDDIEEITKLKLRALDNK